MSSDHDRPLVDRDDLLARVDLEALLDSLEGGAAGRRRWHCPDRDHSDEHPSVSVHVSADGVARWRCWSGGHGGTAIDAVVAARGVDVGEAMRWLAAHYGSLPVREQRPVPPVAPVGHPDPVVARYAAQASKLLWSAAGAPQREWLAGRGLRPEVLRANGVGADPGRRFLPRPRGLPGGWPAVVYPSADPDGTVVYLQARYLDPPQHRSKYDNPSAQLAANPRLAWAQPIGRPQPGLLVVCEGTADALVAAQGGFHAVGVLGAAYPDRRVADGITLARRRHERLGGTVLVCFDGDAPGRVGAVRLTELLDERNVPTATCPLPDGADLTSWALSEPAWARQLADHAATGRDTAPTSASVSLSADRSISIGGIR